MKNNMLCSKTVQILVSNAHKLPDKPYIRITVWRRGDSRCMCSVPCGETISLTKRRCGYAAKVIQLSAPNKQTSLLLTLPSAYVTSTMPRQSAFSPKDRHPPISHLEITVSNVSYASLLKSSCRILKTSRLANR
jgi:hypothetical protein